MDRNRSSRATATRALLVAAFALALLAAGTSQAELVQQFSVRIKGIRNYGAYTLVINSRTYDTEGQAAPLLSHVSLRYPPGVRIRQSFLRGRFFCDVGRLERSSRRNPRVCRHAQIGKGKAIVDLRPVFDETLPATLYAFLARRKQPRAVASAAILAVPDQGAPIVKRYPVLKDVRPLFQGSFIRDPTADRRFEYRLDLPLKEQFSVAEFQLAFPGLTQRRPVRKCVPSSGGVCSKRSRTTDKVFWATQPRCPPSRQIALRATYSFLSGLTATRTASLSCSPLFTNR